MKKQAGWFRNRGGERKGTRWHGEVSAHDSGAGRNSQARRGHLRERLARATLELRTFARAAWHPWGGREGGEGRGQRSLGLVRLAGEMQSRGHTVVFTQRRDQEPALISR